MLREIYNPKQYSGEGFRRWFTDDYFDLIVWYKNDRKTIDGFQLCYDKEHKERALTWRSSGSYVHTGVDDGEIYGDTRCPRFLFQTEVLIKTGLQRDFYERLMELIRI